MLFKFSTQELRYQVRSPFVLISLVLFATFSIFLFSRGLVFVGTLVEGEWVNSPHAIASNYLFYSIISWPFALALCFFAAQREVFYGFHGILYSYPIRKRDFVFGRFVGALSGLVLPALSLAICNVLGVYLGLQFGLIQVTEVTSFQWSRFLEIYAFLIIPNLFILCSFLFSFSLLFRHLGYTLFAGVLLNLLYLMGSMGLANDWHSIAWAALLDPFGDAAFQLDTRYDTAVERNVNPIFLSGHLLRNRLLWLGISLSLLWITYRRFSFSQRSSQFASSKQQPEEWSQQHALEPMPQHQVSGPGWAYQWSVFRQVITHYLLQILRHPAYGLLLLLLVVVFLFDFYHRPVDYGVAQLPMTYLLVEQVRDSDILPLILLIFLCGELFHLDREMRMDEVIDATRINTGTSVLAMAVALWASFLLFFAALFGLGILLQALSGFDQIVLWHYLLEWGIQLAPSLLFWTCFSLLLQSLVRHKFAGISIVLMVFIGQVFWLNYFDIESYLLRLGSTGFYQFSDFNAYGPYLKTNLFLGIYWALASLGLLFLSFLFWRRGKEKNSLQSFRAHARGLSKAQYVLGLSPWALWLLCLVFLIYQTKINNHFLTRSDNLDLKEAYEKRFHQYHALAQPSITKARFEVDLYPQQRALQAKTQLQLKNLSRDTIRQVTFTTRNYNNNNGWRYKIQLAQAQLTQSDTLLGFHHYQLDQPLLPGDSLDLQYQTSYRAKGIENHIEQEELLSNGTFYHHGHLTPIIGYREMGEIRSPKERQARGLAPHPTIPVWPMDRQAAEYYKNTLTDQHAWVEMETIISTSANQIALSAGDLQKQWTKDGRNYFHYRPKTPTLLFNCFISADYALAHRKVAGVDLEIYYHPLHDYNIETMLDEMEEAFRYCKQEFGSYPHQQLRIVEFPRYGNYAQAFPGIMPYSESRGFTLDYDPIRDNNPIASTVAHEIAHQWWGHQVVGAKVAGANFLSESFAEYTSLMMLKHRMGKEKVSDFLAYDYDSYLRGRARASAVEVPLYQVDEQAYLYYRKGSVALYTLAECLGEEKVNQALRQFFEQYQQAPPPFPRSTDFLDILQAATPDSLQYLIQELCYEVVLHDNQLESAELRTIDRDRYQLDLSIRATRIKYEGQKEISTPPQGYWEIGIYADEEAEDLIELKTIELNQAKSKYQLMLPRQAKRVILDPRRLFFDRQLDNNSIEVEWIK